MGKDASLINNAISKELRDISSLSWCYSSTLQVRIRRRQLCQKREGSCSPCLSLRGTGGARSVPLRYINSYIPFSYIKNIVQKLVYHDLTSMKNNCVYISIIALYVVLGIMPQGALQRKSSPLPVSYKTFGIAE